MILNGKLLLLIKMMIFNRRRDEWMNGWFFCPTEGREGNEMHFYLHLTQILAINKCDIQYSIKRILKLIWGLLLYQLQYPCVWGFGAKHMTRQDSTLIILLLKASRFRRNQPTCIEFQFNSTSYDMEKFVLQNQPYNFDSECSLHLNAAIK